MTRHKEDELLEKRFKQGLGKLSDVESPIPRIEEITMLIHDTKRKQRNEFYSFMIVALFLSFCSVALIVNLPGVYLIGQLILLLSIAVGAIIYLRQNGEKRYE